MGGDKWTKKLWKEGIQDGEEGILLYADNIVIVGGLNVDRKIVFAEKMFTGVWLSNQTVKY